MTQPLADRAICSELEPFRRQSHDKHSRRTNRSTDHDHAIRREFLRQRADDRHQTNNYNRIDCRKLPYRSVKPELANSECRKDVVHLQKNRFEKSDEQEKEQQPVKTGLGDQPSKQMCGFNRTLPHPLSDAEPEGGRCAV